MDEPTTPVLSDESDTEVISMMAPVDNTNSNTPDIMLQYSSLLRHPRVKFWLEFSMWPIGFVVVNAVVFILVIILEDGGADYRENSIRETAFLDSFRFNSMVTAIMLILDLVFLYRSAIFVKKQVEAMDTEELHAPINDDVNANIETATGSDNGEANSSSNYSLDHVHAQVSRMADEFLGRGKRPRISILVSLLVLATTLCSGAIFSCVALWGYSNTEIAKDVCSYSKRRESQRSSHNQTGKPMDGIPQDLNQWARRHPHVFGRHSYSDDDKRGSPYFRLVDGTTIFIGETPGGRTSENGAQITIDEGNDDDARVRPPAKKLVSVAPDGTLQVHATVMFPSNCASVQGASDVTSEACCCLFTGQDTSNIHPRMTDVLCVTSGETVASRALFLNASIGFDFTSGRASSISAMSYAGEYWIGIIGDERYGVGIHGDEVRVKKFFLKVKLDKSSSSQTLKIISVANVTEQVKINFYHSNGSMREAEEAGSCFLMVLRIGSLSAAAFLFPASLWLLKVREMPVGIAVSLLAALGLVSYTVSEDLALVLAWLGALGGMVFLLGGLPIPKEANRETLAWALYAPLSFLLASALIGDNDFFVWIPIALLLNFALDHPVLQVTGWMCGIFGSIWGICALFAFPWYDDAWEFLMICSIALLSVMGSCGLVRAGFLLSKYRSYLIFHLSRLLRAIVTAA